MTTKTISARGLDWESEDLLSDTSVVSAQAFGTRMLSTDYWGGASMPTFDVVPKLMRIPNLHGWIPRKAWIDRVSVSQTAEVTIAFARHGALAEIRLQVPESTVAATWFGPSVERIGRLLNLRDEELPSPERAPNPRWTVDALRFLLASLGPTDAPPSFAPLADGGVQIEWHRGGVDVEVIFSPDPDEAGIYIHEKASGAEAELPLDVDAFRARMGSRLAVTA